MEIVFEVVRVVEEDKIWSLIERDLGDRGLDAGEAFAEIYAPEDG